MNKFFSFIGVIALITAMFFGGATAFYYFPNLFPFNEEKNVTIKPVEPDDDKPIDLHLPREKEKTVVTVDDVKVKLKKIEEFSTYSGEYQVKHTENDSRAILDDIQIPMTTNTISITCTGVVKVGYDLNNITVKVDEDKIYIALPEPQVNDNYIIWDTVEYSEKNNILNPINFAQYEDMIGTLETEGLKKAEEEKIYEKAEQNIKGVIAVFFEDFEGYEVVYM